jgi:putative endonuclease
MFYVYVLHSKRDFGLYIGYSTDLRRRLAEHKDGASQATSYRGPWSLIYYEAYVEEVDAIGRERYLKSGGGRKLLRSRRIKNACSMLAAGKRRVCCFDRSGFYDKSLSAPEAAT